MSLYGVLQKAQPRWSVADLCKVHAKLEKANIRDVHSLGRIVMEGDLNSKLAALGERRLKPLTIAHLKTQVRSTYRADQMAREPACELVPRTCFCSQCLLNNTSKLSPARQVVALPEIGSSLGMSTPRGLSSRRRKRKLLQSIGATRRQAVLSLPQVESLPSLGANTEGAINSMTASPSRPTRLGKVMSEPRLPRQAALDSGHLTHSSSKLRQPSGLNSCSASGSGSPGKSRSGVLNLPQVPGGMLPNDEALEELLRVAHCHLKRGFAKPRQQSQFLAGEATKRFEEKTMYQAAFSNSVNWKWCREADRAVLEDIPRIEKVASELERGRSFTFNKALQSEDEYQEDEAEYSEPSGSGYTFTEEEYSEDTTCSYSSPGTAENRALSTFGSKDFAEASKYSPITSSDSELVRRGQATKSRSSPNLVTLESEFRRASQDVAFNYGSDFDPVSGSSSTVAQRRPRRQAGEDRGNSEDQASRAIRRKSWIEAYGKPYGVGGNGSSCRTSVTSTKGLPAHQQIPSQFNEGYTDL